MGGMKSGQGDDLWGDDDDGDVEDDQDPVNPQEDTDSDPTDPRSQPDQTQSQETNTTSRPYIVRRALQDKGIKFERDETLTFFVHDDVVTGEKELVVDMEGRLGRDVPVTDVREAVYRAALQNEEDVLAELLSMGYSVDE